MYLEGVKKVTEDEMREALVAQDTKRCSRTRRVPQPIASRRRWRRIGTWQRSGRRRQAMPARLLLASLSPSLLRSVAKPSQQNPSLLVLLSSSRGEANRKGVIVLLWTDRRVGGAANGDVWDERQRSRSAEDGRNRQFAANCWRT